MRGIIPRRWLRRAGEAAARIRQFPAAARIRKAIAPALEEAAAARPSPYYDRLSEAVRGTHDVRLLEAVLRTLRSVDHFPTTRAPDPSGPLVSVIMPVRNRESVVGDAIRSALAQTYDAFELLVCDDASTDRTARVLASIADDRLRLFHLPEHRGAAPARNLCLREARGAIIAYLDSDNLWHPRYLELITDVLRQSPDAQTAFASYFDLQIQAGGRTVLNEARIRRFDLEGQIEKPFVDINSFVHRRELVERYGGFDERLVRRQDYDLIVRYCWSQAPLHLSHALNLYQRASHLGQITQVHGGDHASPAIIEAKIAAYRREGVPDAALPASERR